MSVLAVPPLLYQPGGTYQSIFLRFRWIDDYRSVITEPAITMRSNQLNGLSLVDNLWKRHWGSPVILKPLYRNAIAQRFGNMAPVKLQTFEQLCPGFP